MVRWDSRVRQPSAAQRSVAKRATGRDETGNDERLDHLMTGFGSLGKAEQTDKGAPNCIERTQGREKIK